MTTAPMPDVPSRAAAESGGAHRALRQWLLACIVAVFLAVVVGGVTRLTESGLSITEWKPVSGVLPPMREAAWEAELEKFRQIPQAQTTHAGITMREFKWIYWWEWFHRLVARGVGLVFAIPFLWFLAKGMIPRGMRLRLAWLPVLTLAQGVLGWYMVQSGLAVRTEVSAYRLAAHLSLALAILVVAVWTWAELRPRAPEAERAEIGAGWRGAVYATAGLLALTIVSGAFVAGLRAGKIYNEFPLMGGRVVPVGYAGVEGWLANAAENPVAAQFHHRVLAVVTALLALVAGWRAGQQGGLPAAAARAVQVLGAVVLLQLTLGVVTLLTAVPVVMGALHQFVGVVALTAAVLAVFELRRGAGR